MEMSRSGSNVGGSTTVASSTTNRSRAESTMSNKTGRHRSKSTHNRGLVLLVQLSLALLLSCACVLSILVCAVLIVRLPDECFAGLKSVAGLRWMCKWTVYAVRNS